VFLLRNYFGAEAVSKRQSSDKKKQSVARQKQCLILLALIFL